MKRYMETSCNGMVEVADGPWISCDDAWDKVRKTNERNNHFIIEAINCIRALTDSYSQSDDLGGNILEDQLNDIISVLNHEGSFEQFLKDNGIVKERFGYGLK